MSKIKKIRRNFLRIIRLGLMLLGTVMLILMLLAFTRIPYKLNQKMAMKHSFLPDTLNTVVVMGAGGFPSENLLMRLWYAKELALKHPEAAIVLTTPGDYSDTSSTIYQMFRYFETNGVDSCRLLVEDEGLNTRHQTLKVREMFEDGRFGEPLVIVTSPMHLLRSCRSFEKAGFVRVGGVPAMNVELEVDLSIREKELGGYNLMPLVSSSEAIRYKFWENLIIEVELSREYLATCYYRIKGWI